MKINACRGVGSATQSRIKMTWAENRGAESKRNKAQRAVNESIHIVNKINSSDSINQVHRSHGLQAVNRQVNVNTSNASQAKSTKKQI